MRIILTKTCYVLHYCYYNICTPIVTYCTAVCFNPLNAELNPICHLLALLGGATIVVVSRLRVKEMLVSAP